MYLVSLSRSPTLVSIVVSLSPETGHRKLDGKTARFLVVVVAAVVVVAVAVAVIAYLQIRCSLIQSAMDLLAFAGAIACFAAGILTYKVKSLVTVVVLADWRIRANPAWNDSFVFVEIKRKKIENVCRGIVCKRSKASRIALRYIY